MVTLGYALSSEEYGPRTLVDIAIRAEQAGLRKLWISDHFHPWNDEQGQSPFVWSVIGALAQATSDVEVYTAVTCPTVRMHPAIVAHAAATSAVLLDGRFGLGLGTGEALNEHIFGDPWPPADVRLEMLEEAVRVIQALWTGEVVDHDGAHYTVENAQLYTLPERPPGIWVSAFGPKATKVAARLATGGYVNSSPDAELLRLYRHSAGKGTAQGSVKVCWGEDADAALDTIHRLWPNTGLPGELAQVLPTPQHFMQASQLVTRDHLASMPHGPDPAPYVEKLRAFADAGYDEVYVQQIGPDQEGVFRFLERELLPALG